MKVYLFYLIIICLFLTGCGNLEMTKFKVSDEKKNIEILIQNMYTNEELEQINNLGLNYDDLNNKYKIECLRKINDGNYKAIYRSEDKFLFVIFDKNGNKKSSSLVVASPKKEEFKNLSLGSNILDVKKVDNSNPQEYVIGNLSSSTASKVTHHFTIDGYQITIFYDKNFNISEVKYELL